MIGRLWFWLFHVHMWETINKTQIYENPSDTMPWSNSYTQNCKKCGKMREYNTKTGYW
jgi:hypothetical protein